MLHKATCSVVESLDFNNNLQILIIHSRTYKVPSKETNGNGEDISDKFSRRINRPKRISPLLNEREKPPVDVVKHAKMIFEKKPETRTKKPHHTGKCVSKLRN